MVQHTAVVLFAFAAASHMQGVFGRVFPQGACNDEHAADGTCCDVDVAETNPQCFGAVNWAMTDGYYDHIQLYGLYDVVKESTFQDFQCALFWISRQDRQKALEMGGPAPNHGCPRPCTSSIMKNCSEPPEAVDPDFLPLSQLSGPKTEAGADERCPDKDIPKNCSCLVAEPIAAICTNATSVACLTFPPCTQHVCGNATNGTNATPLACLAQDSGASSVDPWIIAGVAAVALLLLAVVLYFLMCAEKKKSQKKKKRAVRKEKKAQDPEPAPLPSPESFNAVAPVPVTTTMMTQPMLQQSVYTASPRPTFAANAAAPVYTNHASMVQYQVPQQQPVYTTTAAPVYTNGASMVQQMQQFR